LRGISKSFCIILDDNSVEQDNLDHSEASHAKQTLLNPFRFYRCRFPNCLFNFILVPALVPDFCSAQIYFYGFAEVIFNLLHSIPF
jgi:hypothetical protein